MNLNEIKQKLLNEYKYKIELHAHTSPVSGCSQILPKDMAETYKALGYDGVVITNHFNIRGDMTKEEYLDFYLKDYEETKVYGESLGLKVYLGTEIRFTENNNDYLIFGVNREILSEIYDLLPYGVENFRKTYKMEEGIFIQAHPFRDGMVRVDPELLDGMEVYNLHPNHNSRVALASKYAKEKGIDIIIAGSDYHHPGLNHEGLSALRSTYLPEDSFEIAKILKSKDYVLEIGTGKILL